MRLRAFASRLRLPRTLRPTRAGWVFFALVFAVGFAALNTGNNLLYLVLSLLLSFLVLSGVLSEAALRGITVRRRLPFEWTVGQAGRVVLEIANEQRRVWAHAIVVEDVAEPEPGRAATVGRVLALQIGPASRESRSYGFAPSRRGECSFRGLRVTTRFPFGLFAKSLWLERPASVLVYPRLGVATPPPAREHARPIGRESRGASAAPSEVTGLREFARGDAPRRIHWPASWRRGQLLVRDAEGETAGETEVRLRTAGAAPNEAFEAAVAQAASQADAGLRAGLRVGLRTDAASVAPDSGALHRARLLGYLALVAPDAPATEAASR
jgi:uncharacterized protein (DUF58 family)